MVCHAFVSMSWPFIIFHHRLWVSSLSFVLILFNKAEVKIRGILVIEQIFKAAAAAANYLRHTVLMKILQVSFLSRKSSLPHYLKSHLYRLIWLWTQLSSYSISLFPFFLPFSSLVLCHSHTAVWWEDQGLQRGWITQSEYQQCCSVLVPLLSGPLFWLSLEPRLTAGVAGWHMVLGKNKWCLPVWQTDYWYLQ